MPRRKTSLPMQAAAECTHSHQIRHVLIWHQPLFNMPLNPTTPQPPCCCHCQLSTATQPDLQPGCNTQCQLSTRCLLLRQNPSTTTPKHNIQQQQHTSCRCAPEHAAPTRTHGCPPMLKPHMCQHTPDHPPTANKAAAPTAVHHPVLLSDCVSGVVTQTPQHPPAQGSTQL